MNHQWRIMNYQYWWNYLTQEYERRMGEPDSFEHYLPQDAASQGLYQAYRKMGDTPLDAAQKVLELLTGKKWGE